MQISRAFTGRLVTVAVAAVLAGGMAADAAAQGVRYSFSGAANRIRWDDDLGLKDADLFGGRFGIDFGRLVGLQGYYMRGTDLGTELSRLPLTDSAGAALGDQNYDLTAWGADLALKFGTGRLVPFVKAGGGVFTFSPVDGEDIDQIVGKLGVGFEYDFGDGFRAEVFAQNSRFRMDRYSLAPGGRAGGGYPEDPNSGDLRSNFSVGLGLGVELGGSGAGAGDVADRWSFASIPVEPFGGRLDFDDDALGRRNVGGVRAGIDVGNYLGLRGFYWRGMNSDFDDTERIRAYGGEAQFNLTSGLGPAPYLVVGAGQLDFMDGFVDRDGDARDDEEFLILGGGFGLRLTDNFRLNVAARDHIISLVNEEDIARPDQLQHNWMFTAGLTFNLGRGRSQRATDVARTEEARRERERRVAEEAGREPATERERMAELEAAPRPRPVAPARERSPGEPVVIERELPGGGRVLMLPVPEQGELYVRYGEAAKLEVGRGQAQAQAQPPVWVTPGGGAELSAADMDRLVAAVTARMNQIMSQYERHDTEVLREVVRDELQRMDIDARVESAVSRSLRSQPGQPQVVVVSPDTAAGGGQVVVGQRPPRLMDRLRTPSLYSGFGLNDPFQIVVGGRVRTSTLNALNGIGVVPEVALGFTGDGTSLMLVGNLEYEFGERRIGTTFEFMPVIRAGLGFLSVPDNGTQGVLNFTYGFSSQLGTGSLRWFAEHQGIDLFDRNRLLAGVRWGF